MNFLIFSLFFLTILSLISFINLIIERNAPLTSEYLKDLLNSLAEAEKRGDMQSVNALQKDLQEAMIEEERSNPGSTLRMHYHLKMPYMKKTANLVGALLVAYPLHLFVLGKFSYLYFIPLVIGLGFAFFIPLEYSQFKSGIRRSDK